MVQEVVCCAMAQVVQEVVCCARAASAPGPNGVPYCVYKGAPDVLKCLWKLTVIVWIKRNKTEDVVSGRWYFYSKGEERHDHRLILTHQSFLMWKGRSLVW